MKDPLVQILFESTMETLYEEIHDARLLNKLINKMMAKFENKSSEILLLLRAEINKLKGAKAS